MHRPAPPPDGSHDPPVTTEAPVGPDPGGPARFAILPHGSAIPLPDFGAAEALAPVRPLLTVDGLGSDEVVVSEAHPTEGARNARSPLLGSYLTGMPSRRAEHPVPLVPADRRPATDLHAVRVFARRFTEGQAGSSRSVTGKHRETVDRVNAPGPPLVAPHVQAVAAIPYARVRDRLPRQQGHLLLASFSFSQEDREVTLTPTAGWMGEISTEWGVGIPTSPTCRGPIRSGVCGRTRRPPDRPPRSGSPPRS